jgi:hypothetical protein
VDPNSGPGEYIRCAAVQNDSTHPYYQAVMFPMLKYSPMTYSLNKNSSNSSDLSGRISSVLQSNDQIRGECIAGPTD